MRNPFESSGSRPIPQPNIEAERAAKRNAAYEKRKELEANPEGPIAIGKEVKILRSKTMTLEGGWKVNKYEIDEDTDTLVAVLSKMVDGKEEVRPDVAVEDLEQVNPVAN